MTAFHARAPVRLDFAGGWTDVAPFCLHERGVVVNAAIDLRAHAGVRPGGDRYVLRSDDLNESAELGNPADPAGGESLRLLKAAVRRAGIGAAEVRTRSDVPPGSGLGSSGALDVALVAALDDARGIRRAPLALAEEAFLLEAVDVALPGGRQDQYAASLGGFHRLAFDRGAVDALPLGLDPRFAEELERRIVVCYTGSSRLSSRTIARVMDAYGAGESRVVGALREMVEIADRMAEALTRGDLAGVGRLLDANWRCQRELDPGMRTAGMAGLEHAMKEAGTLGGKAAGAGAGGCMFFLMPGDREPGERAAGEAGARVLRFRWSPEGAQTWRE